MRYLGVARIVTGVASAEEPPSPAPPLIDVEHYPLYPEHQSPDPRLLSAELSFSSMLTGGAGATVVVFVGFSNSSLCVDALGEGLAAPVGVTDSAASGDALGEGLVASVGSSDPSPSGDSLGEGLVVPVITGAIFCTSPVRSSIVKVWATAAPAEPSANTPSVTTLASMILRGMFMETAFP